MKPKVTHWPNGNIQLEEYWQNGQRHRLDGPAIIYYYKNGNIQREVYSQNSLTHKENGPAKIEYQKY